jgi:hypothetical protein
MLYLRMTIANPFFVVRKATLYFESRLAPMIFRKRKPKQLFNLDLHIAVVQEISTALSFVGLRMHSWNMSQHNHLARRWYKFPDPVKYISAKNWRRMDPQVISKFQRYYKRMLGRYEGFVVSYPPAFIELFLDTNKPILVICPTRYEIPYTADRTRWDNLNNLLRNGIESGQITMCVNSIAEQKYFEYYTGLHIEVIPTVCDYLKETWVGNGSTPIFFSKSTKFSEELKKATNNGWADAASVLGHEYAFSDLMKVPAVFILPYNNNTMKMFEFANAGMPVFVPSKSFMKSLYADGNEPGVLSEISNFKVFSVSTDGLSASDPSNYKSDSFIDHWIENSDFYNAEVMQNVFCIDSFEELNNYSDRIDRANLKQLTQTRNQNLKEIRLEFYRKFENKLSTKL